MLTPRRIEIFKAIIEEFIRTAEPVGSKALMERYHLPYSSATIRNDMVKEAEAHKAEDDKHKEDIETKNKAEAYINQIDETLKTDNANVTQAQKDEVKKLRDELQKAIDDNDMNALTKCQENHNSELAPEHILAAMLEDSGLDGIWERLKLNKQELLEFVRGYLERLTTTSSADQPMLSRYVSEGYSHALDEMKKQGDSYMVARKIIEEPDIEGKTIVVDAGKDDYQISVKD